MYSRPLAKHFIFSILILTALAGRSQPVETSSWSCAEINAELREIADSVLHHPDASVRWTHHELLEERLEELLWDDADCGMALFDSLPTLSILTSKDKRVLLISWVIPKAENVYHYGGVLRFQKRRQMYVKALEPLGKLDESVLSRTLLLNEWYGALYYDIIQKGRGKNRHYVVLGWDQFTPTANIKVIDAIKWHLELDEPVFEAPLEDAKGNDVNRMIFGYREDASMSLRYHPKEKRLVWDHLSPINGARAGMADFMVPDFSYDGLKYKRGKWRFLENIAPKNGRE